VRSSLSSRDTLCSFADPGDCDLCDSCILFAQTLQTEHNRARPARRAQVNSSRSSMSLPGALRGRNCAVRVVCTVHEVFAARVRVCRESRDSRSARSTHCDRAFCAVHITCAAHSSWMNRTCVVCAVTSNLSHVSQSSSRRSSVHAAHAVRVVDSDICLCLV
jgi:hypothetical protein